MTEDSRRKHTRHNVRWSCRLLLPDKTILNASVKNISMGGVGIEVSQMIPVGQMLNFEMRPMVLGQAFLFRAKAEATFSMILGGGGGYSQGLRFTLVPDEHKKSMLAIIKILSSGK